MREFVMFFIWIFGLSVFIGIIGLLLGAGWSFLKYPTVTTIASFAILFIVDQYA